MALKNEQIENHMGKARSGIRKWMKNQRNRLIRRVNKEEVPSIKYRGWEF